ncbi:MAG: acetyl-CoA hydrolase/transferase C-terminal domain-containing protein [Polyangiales bacterium]
MNSSEEWKSRAESAESVVARIKSSDRVFVHGAAATPTTLLDALCARQDLEGVRLYHLHLAGRCGVAEPEQQGRLRSVSLFTGPNARAAVDEGRADYVPVFLSDIPDLFRKRVIPLDVAVVQLSMPDAHGHCTLGPSVDAARAAVDSAAVVIAEINAQMPRTHGRTVVPLSRVDAFTITDRPLHEAPAAKQGPSRRASARSSRASSKTGRRCEMGTAPSPTRCSRGSATSSSSACTGDVLRRAAAAARGRGDHQPSQEGPPWTHGDQLRLGQPEALRLRERQRPRGISPCDRTNDTALIRKNQKVVAINSAIEVDLSGQVCADSMGHKIFSGIGGQMDFIRAAALSEGGRPIIALPSTAAGKGSASPPSSSPARAWSPPRGHVHWVVTEHGAVNLHGLTLRERADAMISIAHPDFRAELRRQVSAIRHFAFG